MYGWRHFQPSLTNCPKLSASHASPAWGLQAVVLQSRYWVPPCFAVSRGPGFLLYCACLDASRKRFQAVIAPGFHLFPSRTEQLSPGAPMVLRFKWESRSPPFLRILPRKFLPRKGDRLAGEDFFYGFPRPPARFPPPLPPRPVLFIPSFRFSPFRFPSSLLPSFLPGPFPAFSFILLPPPYGFLSGEGGGAGGWGSRLGFFALKGRGRALLENVLQIVSFSCGFIL